MTEVVLVLLMIAIGVFLRLEYFDLNRSAKIGFISRPLDESDREDRSWTFTAEEPDFFHTSQVRRIVYFEVDE